MHSQVLDERVGAVAHGRRSPLALSTRLLQVGCVAALLVVMPRTARAQEAHEPALARLYETFHNDYLSLGVLLQAVADAQVERTQPGQNGFSIANFRLLLYGRLDAGFGYFLTTNFAGSPSILDAQLSFRASRSLELAVGQFKTPFSHEFLTYAGSIDFVNRSQAVTALAPGRQIGLQARLGGEPGQLLGLAAGIFNGNGTGFNANDDGHFLYASRLVVQPRLASDHGRLMVAANVAYSDDESASFGNGFATDFAGTRLLLGADARFEVGPWLVAGEAIYARLRPDVGGARDPWGFHATLGYRVAPKVQILGRFDGFQPDAGGGRSDLVVLGLNLWPTAATELQVNYLVDTGTAAPEHHQLLVNFQLGF